MFLFALDDDDSFRHFAQHLQDESYKYGFDITNDGENSLIIAQGLGWMGGGGGGGGGVEGWWLALIHSFCQNP